MCLPMRPPSSFTSPCGPCCIRSPQDFQDCVIHGSSNTFKQARCTRKRGKISSHAEVHRLPSIHLSKNQRTCCVRSLSPNMPWNARRGEMFSTK
ncbi:unnamed protein product [Mycena citricolor]|uniref:Uncharacterized protein n=1 Tax=Mycena citricolor TaxID=2018698 RepID=A0AAD2HAZ4_9AGAR|nr:unnamed protein product [Mycena citricolor]